MAFRKNSVSKTILITSALIIWSASLFWIGWKSPEVLGGPFVTKEVEIVKPRFYPLERFVISVPGDKAPHYLLLELSLKSESMNVTRILKEADPLIRNTLMRMFSQKHFDQLNNLNQLDNLQDEALTSLSKVLEENQFSIDIDEVLFTRMVIQ